MGKQIFLSYGRQDASHVAEQVADYLISKGFKVWMDRPEIKPGIPFLEKIKQAIHDSDLVVAILSPHAVRRVGDSDYLDSVCLDELSIARFSQTPTPIVPAMAVMCEPPMVIYRLQYVDLSSQSTRTTNLPELLEGIQQSLLGHVRYRSWVDSLRPWDFEPFLREKRFAFVGRDWLHDRVISWLENKTNEPALLIIGDPGSGKSAFVASLVERSDGALLGYHCCQANTPETLNPGRFVRSISAMIASRLPAYEIQLTGLLKNVLDEASCQADPFSAFEEGVLAPLTAIETPPKHASFILIDALDEASLYREGAGGATIIDLLADRLNRFPRWLRIIATSRKEPALLRKLRGIRHDEIDVHSKENIGDVETYVRLRGSSSEFKELFAEEDAGNIEKLVAEMRNAGNFLYVAETLNALARGQTSLDDLGQLPVGLYGLYEGFFSRTFPKDDKPENLDSARLLLSVVLAAQEPMTESQLAEATGLTPDDELAVILKKLTPYLPASIGEDNKLRYQIYHKSFADWLQETELRGTRFYVSTKKGHAQLAAIFAKAYAQGTNQLSLYNLHHGPHHLVSAGENSLLYRVLTDVSYVRSVHEQLGVTILYESYSRANAALPEGSERETLGAIGSALRLSLSSALREPLEFEVQLEIRLRSVDRLDTFRKALRHHFSPTVLVPDTIPLTLATGPLLFSLKTGFAVSAVCVYEPGNLLISGDEEGQLRVWRLEDGIPILSVQLTPSSASCGITFPNQPVAAIGTYEGGVLYFDLESGEVRSAKSPASGRVSDLCFDPTYKMLLSAHEKHLICWSWPELNQIWMQEFKDEELEAICYSTDGTSIYLTTRKHLLQLNVRGEEPKLIREAPPLEKPDPWGDSTTHAYFAMAMRDDGLIALGRDDGRIEIIRTDKKSPLLTISGHPVEHYNTSVSGLDFINDDQLVSAGWDDALRIWNVQTGEELHSLRGNSKIFDMAVFNAGKRAVTGHKMLATNVWDLETAGRVEGEQNYATDLQVSESLGIVVARVGFHHIALWDLETGSKQNLEFEQLVAAVGLDAVRAELLVVVGSEIRAIDLKKLDQGQLIDTINIERYQEVAWSPNAKMLVVEEYGGANLWRRDGDRSRFDTPEEDSTIFAMSLANTCLAVVTGNQIRVHQLTDNHSTVKVAIIEQSTLNSALSPNGKTLAIGDEDGRISGFDTTTAKNIWNLQMDEPWISQLYLTNSGMLYVGIEDAIYIYNVVSGKRLAQLHSENRWGDCWMSDDSSKVVVGGIEGSLHMLRRHK